MVLSLLEKNAFPQIRSQIKYLEVECDALVIDLA